MATKAQIARKMYGESLAYLSAGKKAAVTKAFNAQGTSTPAPRRAARSGTASVKFGRPGVNGVKECLVSDDTSMGDALEQAGLKINKSKEGILAKDTGAIVMYADKVTDGVTYVITPGIDSSI